MPAVEISPSDLHIEQVDEDKAEAIIAGVLARAVEFAPCLVDPAFTKTAAAKDILVDVIVRRYSAGAGAWSQQSAGPHSLTVDTRTRIGVRFQPEEIAELQALCRESTAAVPPAVPLFCFPPAPTGWPC